MHQFLSSISQAGLSTLFSALKLYDTDFHSLGLHFSPFCKVHVYMHHTWTGKHFVTFQQIVIRMATMHYIIQVDTAFLCKYSFLIIMCVLLQGDSCEGVGVQLVQTLTVVFPPPIKGGLIGKSPLFQLSTPNSKPEANLPEFRVSKRMIYMYRLPQLIHTEWSLQLLFTKPLISSCPLASSSKLVLDSSNLMVSHVLTHYPDTSL